MGEALGAIAEKICLAACECEQSLFRRRMRFDRAVGPDMAKRQSTRGQRPADQQTAVAVKRLALGTQQTDAVVRALVQHSREPGGEFRPRGSWLCLRAPA